MSLLSNLEYFQNALHSKKRVGRGKGSGLGQTSGKGHKGQLARSGGKVRRGFEGGQTPLVRRLPKVGFSNVSFRKEVVIVKTSDLSNISNSVIDKEVLFNCSLIKCAKQRVKVLADGEVSKAIILKVDYVSEAAKSIIELKGGKVEVL